VNGPTTNRKSRPGYKLDQRNEQGKWVKIGDYKQDQVIQLTAQQTADYRLRNSGLQTILFSLKSGQKALVMNMSYRVLEMQAEESGPLAA
jgi:hypothetical protein